MYVPKPFEIEDWPEISKFIRANPLATLVSRGADFPMATHIPLELEEEENGRSILSGHVAKANPHWRLFKSDPGVLAIFL